VTMTREELKSALEAIIYVADEPATLDHMAGALGEGKTEIRAVLDELVASYAAEGRGVEIRKVAGGWKFYTKAQHHDVVRKFIKSLRPPLRLTMPALETLAVIAYKQPATGPEIQEIRGVNCAGVIKTLLEKRLITTAGRKEVIGRPILYRTSKEFLMRFGLSDVDELPSLKEFEQLAQAALGSDEGIAPIEPEGAPLTETAPTDADLVGTAATGIANDSRSLTEAEAPNAIGAPSSGWDSEERPRASAAFAAARPAGSISGALGTSESAPDAEDLPEASKE
jgi:segregation and condensation protein B